MRLETLANFQVVIIVCQVHVGVGVGVGVGIAIHESSILPIERMHPKGPRQETSTGLMMNSIKS